MTRAQQLHALLQRSEEAFETRIERGIEDHRKGNFTLKLTDPAGNPIPGKIELHQLDHDFNIGGNLFMLDQMETAEKNDKYRKYFAECFNTATIPFYWNTLEPEKGKPRFAADSPFIYRRPPIDPCVDFCEENDIIPKAHCLNYDHFTPEWLLNKDVPTIKRALVHRFEELADRYANRIPCWEVFNELLCNNGATPFYQEEDLMKWSYAQAERFFPGNELMMNESNWHIFTTGNHQHHSPNCWNPYYLLCKQAIDQGCRVDSIGMQFHYLVAANQAVNHAYAAFDLTHHFAILDQFAKLGRPLQITEITFPAFDETPEDYAVQAEMMHLFYRVWFSHPAMEGAIYWNLPDGYAYMAEPGDMSTGENFARGGLLDFHLDPKPAYQALYDLFHKDYCTNVTAELNEGSASFRGYFGKYRVEAGGKSAIVEFQRGAGTDQTVTLANF